MGFIQSGVKFDFDPDRLFGSVELHNVIFSLKKLGLVSPSEHTLELKDSPPQVNLTYGSILSFTSVLKIPPLDFKSTPSNKVAVK